MRSMAVLTGLLLVAACQAVPLAPPDSDAAGKRFDPPPPGQSALYVVREGNFNSAFAHHISVGSRVAGSLGSRQWLRIDVEAGKHVVRCQGENVVTTPIEVAAGDIRFLEVTAIMGWNSARCRMREIDAATGRNQVLSSRRAEELH